MSTKYLYYSYLRTAYKKINLTAYSNKDIGRGNDSVVVGLKGDNCG